MIPLDTLILFCGASIALALAPGPDNLFVVTQSLLHGRRAGILVTLGLMSGLVVHTALVALGVAAILQTSPLAFTVLKVAGALYLLWLAWQAFRAGASGNGEQKSEALTTLQLFRRGVIMNTTNPKVAIFFLAFLPQFVQPQSGSVTVQIILLGCVFMLCALLVFSLFALTAAMFGQRLNSSATAQKFLQRLAGVVFLGMAVRLLLSEQ